MMRTTTEPRRKPPSILETERLLLRRPRLEDAEAMYNAYTTDAEVTKYLTWAPHANVAETQDFLSRAIEAWKTGERFIYAIEHKANGEIMGNIEISITDDKGGLGYVLAKQYWNKGYMTEAVKALIRWGLQQRHCQRIDAVCDIENDPSARVMEKAGMQFEGILRRWCHHPNRDPKKFRNAKIYSAIPE